MKVYYKPNILEQIKQANIEAKKVLKKIDYIALTPTEFDEALCLSGFGAKRVKGIEEVAVYDGINIKLEEH